MTELEPLIDYHHQDPAVVKIHNFGTVVNFAPWTSGRSKRKIGDWRITHPELNVFVAYGVNASHYPDEGWGMGHGSHIAVEGKGIIRYYWFGAGGGDWDTLRIPQRIIADWDEGEMSRQLHYPDLKWFEPYYGAHNFKINMSREELSQEIKRRVATAL